MSETVLPTRAVLARGLRCRCPACGRGEIFVRGFESRERCPACDFRLERGPGHYIGGAEINLLVNFPVSVLALAVPAFVWGGNWATASAGALLAVVIGVGIHRPARGLFFAIDYLIDPRGDAGDADGPGPDGGGDRAPAPHDGPGGSRARPAVVELPVPTPAPRPDAEPQPSPPPQPSPARPGPFAPRR